MVGSNRHSSGGRIGVVGSNMVDLVTYIDRMPEAGETLAAPSFSMGHGGKGANQAVAAARLGGDVMLVSRVGDDLFGGLAQRLEFARLVRRNSDREIDAAVADQNFGDEAEFDDVALEIGPLDATQLVEDLRLGNRHAYSPG